MKTAPSRPPGLSFSTAGALLLQTVFALILLSLSVAAQVDPGIPDTVRVDSVTEVLGSQAQVPVRFINDETLVGIEVTLTTDFAPLVLDSFSFAGGRVEYIATRGWVTDSSGTAITAYCFPTDEPVVPVGEGLLGYLFVTNPDATTPRVIRIDTISFEIDLVFRSTMFSDTFVTAFVPQFRPGYISYQASCCMGDTRGNVNYDSQDLVDISDLTFLVNMLFVLPGKETAPCTEEANVNGSPDAIVDISDLTYLVNHLFVAPESYPLLPCSASQP